MTTVLSPIDGSALGEVPDATPAEIDAAFERARAALEEWRGTSATRRGEVLRAVSDGIAARAAEFAATETANMGRSAADTAHMANRAAQTFAYFGGYADKVTGDVIQVPGEFHTYTRREPHGVVAAIVPWNAPLIFAAKKLAPALAFGNVCLLKPAAETPLTALLLAEVMAEAGVPDGVAQVVTGGREAGEALVADRRTDFVIFTGHHATGKAIARAAAENLTPIALELGGKSPQIVFADADLDAALEGVVDGIYGEVGQACIAGSRLLVAEEVHAEFTARLAARTAALRVGDPRDPAVEIGPQITPGQRDKTLRMIGTAVDEGATLAASAPVPDDPALAGGFYVSPTMFTDVTAEMEIMREEVFGPVLAVTRFGSEEEAVRIANDTDFGLSAGIWTTGLARAHRVAARLDAGTVWLNTYARINDQVPFGGIGLSGYGREGGASAVETYTRVKSVWTSLSGER